MTESAQLPLVGRERELGAIDDALRGLRASGMTLLLRGEPGAGKSALLHHAAECAEQMGLRLLRTVGVPSEAEMPFAGLHQLLLPILDQTAMLPVKQRDAILAALGAADERPETFLVALAVLSLLGDVATPTPVVALVDDAHWLDDETCKVLTFVARRLDADPVLLLVCSREGSETAFDRAELPELSVDALGSAAAAELLERRSPQLPQDVRERILSEAEGNPLALVELPAAWEDRGPVEQPLEWMPLTTRLERAFAARAQSLPRSTRTLLLVAALNSTGSLGETLSAASRTLGAEATLDDLGAAEAARLITLADETLSFRHPLIRSAIAQGASMAEHHAVHASLAEVLEGRDDRWIWHRAACTVGTSEAVASELEKTASGLQRRPGGTAAAAAALQRAAQLSPSPARRGHRLLTAAELAHGLGRPDLAAQLLGEAGSLDLEVDDRRRVLWLQEFTQLSRGPGRVPALVAIAEEMRQSGEIDSALQCLVTAARKCWWPYSPPSDGELVLAALDRVEDQGHPNVAASRLYCDLTDPGFLTQAQAFATAPSRDSDDIGATIRVAAALTLVPDPVAARDILSTALARARSDGRAGLACEALVSLGDAALYSGDLTLSLRCADECERLADEVGRQESRAFALLTQATVLGLRGHEARATDLLSEAEPVLFTAWAPFMEVARSAVALAAGRHEDAFAHIRRPFDPRHPAFNPLIGSRGLMDLAETGVRTGNRDEAQAGVDRIVESAERSRSPFLVSSASCAAAVLATDEESDALFAAASAGVVFPFLQARLLLHHGARLRRRRRIAESRLLLRDALDGFDALGAVPWAERTRQELRASGEKVRRRDSEHRDQLTPQELQIAQMAADGLTNREIGERLFLSHRTVSSHLYKIFPKLNISSRTEGLAAALSPRRVGDDSTAGA